jgi:hypothetical protein
MDYFMDYFALAATIGTATPWRRSQIRKLCALQISNFMDDPKKRWICHPVMDEASFAARQHNARLA